MNIDDDPDNEIPPPTPAEEVFLWLFVVCLAAIPVGVVWAAWRLFMWIGKHQ